MEKKWCSEVDSARRRPLHLSRRLLDAGSKDVGGGAMHVGIKGKGWAHLLAFEVEVGARCAFQVVRWCSFFYHSHGASFLPILQVPDLKHVIFNKH